MSFFDFLNYSPTLFDTKPDFEIISYSNSCQKKRIFPHMKALHFRSVRPQLLVLILAIATSVNVYGQELINGTYNFQSDPEKKYTLYVPSSYEQGEPTAVMLGLHPLNTARWDAESWCDTLSDFAEANDLLLVCPDGGADGRIDDAIDTAFTTFLLDEVSMEYTVDPSQVYAVGFSWGGKTVYTYGLQHADRFAGFIVVGAAVTPAEVDPIKEVALDQKFYVIHGANDSPQVRYTPIIELLDDDHCVESVLMPGVGHTIDFEGRNMMLTTALEWIRATSCGSITTSEDVENAPAVLRSTVLTVGQRLQVADVYATQELTIFNSQGQLAAAGLATDISIQTAGMYFVVTAEGQRQSFMVVE